MSQLNVDTIKKADGTGSLTVPAETGTVVTTASPSLGRRNALINGDMTICQRGGEGSSATFGSTNTYHIDRWLGREDTDGALASNHSTEAPDGFRYSQKVTVTTADASLGAAQKAYFSQRIEGTNFAQFAFGTAGAKTVTLSFYVRSSVTGTFSGSLTNQANNRAYVFEYAISSADTWERKEVTITGDTSGTWATTSSTWSELYFDLGVGSNFEGTAGSWVAAQDFGSSGSTKLINTLNATWYITGVQLEVGSVATPFEHRSYGEELALCQRYYYRISGRRILATGHMFAADQFYGNIFFPVEMRDVITLSWADSSNYYRCYSGSSTLYSSGLSGTQSNYNGGCSTGFYISFGGSLTRGDGAWIQIMDDDAWVDFSAEL